MFIGQSCKVHLKKNELPSGALIVSCSKYRTVVKDRIYMKIMITLDLEHVAFMDIGPSLIK